MNRTSLTLVALLFTVTSAEAQTATALVATPDRIELRVGESAQVSVAAMDASGAMVAADFRWSGERNAINYSDGVVTGVRAGEYELNVSTIVAPGREPLTLAIPVVVQWPEIDRVAIETDGGRLYAGTRVAHRAVGYHADGSVRPYPDVRWQSENEGTASVDVFGNVSRAPRHRRDSCFHRERRGTNVPRSDGLPSHVTGVAGRVTTGAHGRRADVHSYCP